MDYVWNNNLLRVRILDKFGSMKAFAEALGITSIQLSKKMRGKAGISRKDIIKWCRLLDIDLMDVGKYFFYIEDLTC